MMKTSGHEPLEGQWTLQTHLTGHKNWESCEFFLNNTSKPPKIVIFRLLLYSSYLFGLFFYQYSIVYAKLWKITIPSAIFHSITWFSMVCRNWQTFFHLNEIHFMTGLSLIVFKMMVLHILIWFSSDVEHVYLTMIWFPDEKGVTNEKELDALSN